MMSVVFGMIHGSATIAKNTRTWCSSHHMAVQVDRFTISELFPAFAVLPPKSGGASSGARPLTILVRF
jgi:hypothetical protein